jgi:acetyltransferase-like isoleucine patch superfamily enzyme
MLGTWWYALQMRMRLGARIESGVQLKGLRNIKLGARCKLHRFCTVDAGKGRIHMGMDCTLNRYAILQSGRGSLTLGNRVEINNYAIVNGAGGLQIGDGSMIGPGAKLISYQHGIAAGTPIQQQPNQTRPITIGQDVWVGANAVVLAGVTIGNGAVIGAGAVVTTDVPANEIWVGVPARRLRSR